MKHRMPPDQWEALVREALRRGLVDDKEAGVLKAVSA